MQIKVNVPEPIPLPPATYDITGLTAQQLGLIVAVLGAVPSDEYNISYAEWERMDDAATAADVPARLRDLPGHIQHRIKGHFR